MEDVVIGVSDPILKFGFGTTSLLIARSASSRGHPSDEIEVESDCHGSIQLHKYLTPGGWALFHFKDHQQSNPSPNSHTP